MHFGHLWSLIEPLQRENLHHSLSWRLLERLLQFHPTRELEYLFQLMPSMQERACVTVTSTPRRRRAVVILWVEHP